MCYYLRGPSEKVVDNEGRRFCLMEGTSEDNVVDILNTLMRIMIEFYVIYLRPTNTLYTYVYMSYADMSQTVML